SPLSVITTLAPVSTAHTLVPSNASAWISWPTVNVPPSEPSGFSLETLLALFATQILEPSNARALGLLPTVKAPSRAPSLARSLAIVPPAPLGPFHIVTQRLAP